MLKLHPFIASLQDKTPQYLFDTVVVAEKLPFYTLTAERLEKYKLK